jgi:hypothetical protein
VLFSFGLLARTKKWKIGSQLITLTVPTMLKVVLFLVCRNRRRKEEQHKLKEKPQ